MDWKSLLKKLEGGSRTCVFHSFTGHAFHMPRELLNFSILFADTGGDYCFLFGTFPVSTKFSVADKNIVWNVRIRKSNISEVFRRFSQDLTLPLHYCYLSTLNFVKVRTWPGINNARSLIWQRFSRQESLERCFWFNRADVKKQNAPNACQQKV